VPEVGDQEQVLLAREQVVDGGELAGDADRGANPVRLALEVEAGDLDLAAVRGEERREDLHGGRLPGPVRAEEREDRSLCDLEVDPVEDGVVAERLSQPRDPQRGPRCGRGCGHDPFLSLVSRASHAARWIVMSP
jgi:hypothetical protein